MAERKLLLEYAHDAQYGTLQGYKAKGGYKALEKALSESVDVLIKDINMLFSEKNVKGIETLIGNTNNAIVSGSSNIEKITTNMKDTSVKLERVLNEVEDIIHSNKAEVAQLIKKAREDLNKAGDMIASIEKAANSVDSAVNLQSDEP